MDEPLPLVKNADQMDETTFLKHINARHVPLAGMSKVGKSNVPGDEEETLLRAYHDILHSSNPEHIEQSHTHKD